MLTGAGGVVRLGGLPDCEAQMHDDFDDAGMGFADDELGFGPDLSELEAGEEEFYPEAGEAVGRSSRSTRRGSAGSMKAMGQVSAVGAEAERSPKRGTARKATRERKSAKKGGAAAKGAPRKRQAAKKKVARRKKVAVRKKGTLKKPVRKK